MRFTVTAFGRTLAADLTVHLDAPEACEPDRQGATCADLDRAPTVDHDTRPRIGFDPEAAS